jgi:hypothetical protein
VSLVARLTLVHNVHSTEGSSLCQFLPFTSRSWNILVFIPCSMSLFPRSTWSFMRGCATNEASWLIPKSVQHLANFAPLDWVSLLVKTHFRAQDMYLILCRNLTNVSYVMFTTGLDFIHFVNVSVTEPPQKWGVCLPGSGSGDSRRSENACKHTYEAFEIIISFKIKLLHFSLKITVIRSRRFFKR